MSLLGRDREYTCFVRSGSGSYCCIFHRLSAWESQQVERYHPTNANAPSTLANSRSDYRNTGRNYWRGLLAHWHAVVSRSDSAFRLRCSRHCFHPIAGCFEEPATRKRRSANWIEHSDLGGLVLVLAL